MELEVFMELRDEPFVPLHGYCSRCQLQVPKHDSGKLPPCARGWGCHLRAVFSALGENTALLSRLLLKPVVTVT